jgi:hypothetical protein
MPPDPSLDLLRLRDLLRQGRFEWSKHALQRMAKRGISQADATAVLDAGDQIEDYPQDKPYPSGLFLGWIDDRPIHVVAALDALNGWVYVITAYEPGLDRFGPDYRTRR